MPVSYNVTDTLTGSLKNDWLAVNIASRKTESFVCYDELRKE